MALEAVVFSQAGGHFGYGLPWCDLPGGAGFGFPGEFWDHDDGLLAPDVVDEWETRQDQQQSSEASTEGKEDAADPAAAAGRRKRRRAKVVKNKEEIETQRMTHIAVERNRRRQMNEYLAVLRSLMPPSYAHRGDQASIVGGAINYVRELEQLLQSLEVQKSIKNRAAGCGCTDAAAGKSPFAGFFTFPQYSTSSSHAGSGAASSSTSTTNAINGEASTGSADSDGHHRPAAVADIEVTMVEGHASLKVLAPRRPKQLLKLVAGLHQLRVPPLHLNMTSVDAMVLYTFSLKVEDDSKMGSVEDIATAVHEILSSVQRQEETAVM
ncbi:hypothetical protein PR202_gb18835 [Eleusine coracana subsp. coracana]|uniref:BHLH domain-containing protein n=1 Tax=Eleusine coracana subsp. coracana TaxID=191504 RepID=A0AAV5F6M7_ELECO|nr:hypothetical protein QOZ80_3BG0291360 [Eleusine coracana subsp. coracana]GJN30522.1 hypothetical protein PR202_gb18835 [Eleusine coracana subsp. coracana]